MKWSLRKDQESGRRVGPSVGLVGSMWRCPPRGANTALEVEWLTTDTSGAILWPGLAWPSQELVLGKGCQGPVGGADPSQPWRQEGERAEG